MTLEEIGIRTLFKLTVMFSVLSALCAGIAWCAGKHLDKVYRDLLELLKDREEA